MEITKIEIKDPSLFTQIAFIVDQQAIRTDIEKLQKKWQGKTIRKSGNSKEIYTRGAFGNSVEFDNDVLSLLRKHSLSIVYAPIMEQAIKKGTISQFPRVQKLFVPRDLLEGLLVLSDEQPDIGGYEYALITPLEATEKEISETFNELKELVKKTASSNNPLTQQSSDTVSNIERDRVWYWKNQPKKKGGNGKSYYTIALEEKRQNKDRAYQYADTVRKAIKQYQQKLKQHTSGNLQPL